MKKFWVSWYETKPQSFEYHGPWWVSGYAFDPPRQTICAAVVATDAEAAKRVIEEMPAVCSKTHWGWRSALRDMPRSLLGERFRSYRTSSLGRLSPEPKPNGRRFTVRRIQGDACTASNQAVP